jgi:hypothetical protein
MDNGTFLPVTASKIVEELNKHAIFRIEPFDERAAIEVAAMARSDLGGGRKKRAVSATYAKLKYDRQIVAIAKVTQSDTIHSDDGDIRTIAKRAGIKVVGLADLPLPAESAQHVLPLPLPREPKSQGRQTQRRMPVPRDATDKNQHQRFVETARALERDEDEAKFEKKLGKIARATTRVPQKNQKP